MQETFVIDQLAVFSVTVALGLLIGFAFDVVRVMQRYVRLSRHVQFFVDLFFWLTATVFVFLVLMASNWGEVRAYVFIGLAAGCGFYRLALSKSCYRTMSKLADLLIKVCKTLVKPFIVLFIKIRRLVLFFYRKGHGVARTTEKTAKIFLQKFKRKKKD